MNLASIYPRPALAPLSSVLTLVQAKATQFAGMRYTVRPTAESLKAQRKAIDAAPAFLPTLFLATDAAHNKEAAARRASEPVPDAATNLILSKTLESLDGLKRDGGARQWFDLYGMVKAMVAIQHQGAVCIDAGVILAAWEALAAIQARHMNPDTHAWAEPIKLLAPEISRLDRACHHNGAQLLHLDKGDFITAVKASEAWPAAHLLRVVAGMRKELANADG